VARIAILAARMVISVPMNAARANIAVSVMVPRGAAFSSEDANTTPKHAMAAAPQVIAIATGRSPILTASTTNNAAADVATVARRLISPPFSATPASFIVERYKSCSV
jgi:hypothetical protein